MGDLTEIANLVMEKEEQAFQRGREDALEEVRALVQSRATPARKPVQSRATPAQKPKPVVKQQRKNPWATMTPAQKKKRVTAMLAGRGLKPKRKSY